MYLSRYCATAVTLLLLAPLYAHPLPDVVVASNLSNPIFRSPLEFLENPVPVADSVASIEAEMKSYYETIHGTEITIRMIPIPGGKFLMGSPDTEEGRHEDEAPQHEVEVKPFWMGEHEITWLQFKQFMLWDLRNNRTAADTLTARERTADALALPTHFWGITPGLENRNKAGFPASAMTIYAAQMYCRWLTIMTGRYYRLPTEAEWEYAARAGSTTAFSFGDDAESLDDYAWWYGNSGGEVQRIKRKKPNAWGLYDMHGNVTEWVLEQYAMDTYANRQPDMFGSPVNPALTRLGMRDAINVLRGGSADSDEPGDLRSARRLQYNEDWRREDPNFPRSIWWLTDAPHVGFRIVRPLEPPKTEEEARRYEPDPVIWFDNRNTSGGPSFRSVQEGSAYREMRERFPSIFGGSAEFEND